MIEISIHGGDKEERAAIAAFMKAAMDGWNCRSMLSDEIPEDAKDKLRIPTSNVLIRWD